MQQTGPARILLVVSRYSRALTRHSNPSGLQPSGVQRAQETLHLRMPGQAHALLPSPYLHRRPYPGAVRTALEVCSKLPNSDRSFFGIIAVYSVPMRYPASTGSNAAAAVPIVASCFPASSATGSVLISQPTLRNGRCCTCVANALQYERTTASPTERARLSLYSDCTEDASRRASDTPSSTTVRALTANCGDLYSVTLLIPPTAVN